MPPSSCGIDVDGRPCMRVPGHTGAHNPGTFDPFAEFPWSPFSVSKPPWYLQFPWPTLAISGATCFLVLIIWTVTEALIHWG